MSVKKKVCAPLLFPIIYIYMFENIQTTSSARIDNKRFSCVTFELLQNACLITISLPLVTNARGGYNASVSVFLSLVMNFKCFLFPIPRRKFTSSDDFSPPFCDEKYFCFHLLFHKQPLFYVKVFVRLILKIMSYCPEKRKLLVLNHKVIS